MAGSEPTTPARLRLPAGLLGMLALIAGVESLVAGHGTDLRDLGDWGWAVTRKRAQVDGPNHEVLVFGDSLAKLGVVPSLIEARSGLSTYNLAVCEGKAPSSYFLLRRAIESGARPSAILVDFFPRLLQLGPRQTLLWPALLDTREALELAWVARDSDLFASILVQHLLPTSRARLGVRSALFAALDGRVHTWGLETPVYRRNWRRNLGAQVMPSGVNPSDDFPRFRRDFFSDLNFDPVNLAFMDRFLSLAASRSIPVYYLIPPIKPGLQAECERSGFDEAYVAFLKGVQSRYPNVVVVDGRHSSYDPALFFDPNHLGRDGAWAYSTALGDLLRNPPPEARTDRWVALPRYSGLPVGTPPEDINQSRAAILADARPGVARR